MSVQTYPWESHLVAMAHEAMTKEPKRSQTNRLDLHFPWRDHTALENAYEYCDQVTKEHSQTFYLASALLPADKRRAMRALYAFCRYTDNLVDGNPNTSLSALDEWRTRSLEMSPAEDDLIALAWADTRDQFEIPRQIPEQLIDGVAQDLVKTRYHSFDELAAYCYGVASTVGLMAMHIIGYRNDEAVPYAVKLGVALQLTNILRDVDEDWQAGRLYLPLDELVEFGLTEEDIAERKASDKWSAFMEFQIERTHRLYGESKKGICLLHPDGRFAVRAAADLYQAILEVILENRGNIFNHRASVSNLRKISRLPSIWWQSFSCSFQNA